MLGAPGGGGGGGGGGREEEEGGGGTGGGGGGSGEKTEPEVSVFSCFLGRSARSLLVVCARARRCRYMRGRARAWLDHIVGV